ncbi:MAG: MFS transporter [Halieaceae bacterium]
MVPDVRQVWMFFGWRVVAGSFVSMMLIIGFFTYTFTLFVVPLREEFDASLVQVMFGLTLGTFLGLVISPVSGILIDRYPVRLLMTVGCLLVAAGFWGMSTASSISAFSIMFALTFSLGNGLAGAIAGSAAVSRWFIRSRGRALGITTMGTSVGGMAMPVLATWWLAEYGWRGALENMALLALLVVTPLVWLNIRGKPEDLGLQAEGADELESGNDTQAQALDMQQIIRRRDFWLIALGVGLTLAVFSSMLANLSPYATQLGASKVQASSLIMFLAISGLIGKILFGMAADRFSLKSGLWVAQGLVACCFLILATQPPYSVMILAAVCLGFATGGLLPVWNAMMAHVFGVDSYGRAMGAMGPVITLLIVPAYTVVGKLYDLQGDYTLCLLIFTGIIVLASALLIPLRINATPA